MILLRLGSALSQKDPYRSQTEYPLADLCRLRKESTSACRKRDDVSSLTFSKVRRLDSIRSRVRCSMIDSLNNPACLSAVCLLSKSEAKKNEEQTGLPH